jgi:hypothetical protein
MVVLELEMGRTAIQTPLGKQNHWAIVCPDSRVKGGLWKKWLAEKCVAIGWSPKSYRMHGSTKESGWRRARKRVQEIVPGDIVIPYLRNYTFGVPGKVVRVAASDEEWSPTVSAGNDTEYPDQWTLGRRIKVKWLEKGVPSFDKVAVVPKTMQRRGIVIRPAIEPLNGERLARIVQIIRTPANWRPYQQVQANNGSSRATPNSKVPVTLIEAGGADDKTLRSTAFHHYIAYHSTEKWGRWTVAPKGRLDSFFTAKKYRPETLVGNCLWAIEGFDSPKRYRLVSFGFISRVVASKRPAPYKGSGRSIYFRVHPNFTRFEVTGLRWFEKLRKQQQSFRYGFNKISDRAVITELEKILAGSLQRHKDAVAKRRRAARPNRSQRIEYGDVSDVEGTLTEARMARRGRSRRLRKAALQRAAGVCTVCRLDFREILVGRGVRVLQVHHLSQLAATDAPRITTLKDLAVVCANCHILLHLNSKRALTAC